MQDWYNDWQNMVRSDRIEDVIDRHRVRRGRDVSTDEQKRAKNDLQGILDAVYACAPSSYLHVVNLFATFANLTPDQLALAIHTLRGGTFTEYASCEGVSKAAIGQRWKTVVKRSPKLSKAKRGRYGHDEA